jgi:DNA-binding protein YbaB
VLTCDYYIFAKKSRNMFGDMMQMMGKLKETQKKVEETKERLNHVLVSEQSSDGLLKLSMTANRKLKTIEIATELLNDKEQLEDYLILHINHLIEKASKVQETELAAVAKEGMPNIPGMDFFK